ncbi:MAG TPA: hypothetical protein VKI99_17990 [Candidatus Dormibacteraeota bacterium]|nr:hypothetical protein [Candidatus Dormibacteraeota bacterium]
MNRLRRLALAACMAVVLSAGPAILARAGGGPGLGPGSFTFTSTSANAFFGSPKGAPGPSPTFASVFVNRGLTTFEPQDSDGATTVQDATTVFVSIFTPTGGGGGCFVIPNRTDFTIGSDLHSASLHTTVGSADVCPGLAKPLAVDGPLPLGGGGGGGIALPIRLDLTWTWKGVIGTDQFQSQFECGDFSTASQSESRSAGATATGTIAAGTIVVSGSSQQGGLRSTDSQLDISGSANPACFG